MGPWQRPAGPVRGGPTDLRPTDGGSEMAFLVHPRTEFRAGPCTLAYVGAPQVTTPGYRVRSGGVESRLGGHPSRPRLIARTRRSAMRHRHPHRLLVAASTAVILAS